MIGGDHKDNYYIGVEVFEDNPDLQRPFKGQTYVLQGKTVITCLNSLILKKKTYLNGSMKNVKQKNKTMKYNTLVV